MNGNMLRVAACRVKPYELITREEVKSDGNDKSCENVENDGDKQDVIDDKEEREEDSIDMGKIEVAVDTKYMQMKRSVCFSENAGFTVEVPVSDIRKGDDRHDPLARLETKQYKNTQEN